MEVLQLHNRHELSQEQMLGDWWRQEELNGNIRDISKLTYEGSFGRRCILRPVLTASRPSHTIAQIGPLSMSGESKYLNEEMGEGIRFLSLTFN